MRALGRGWAGVESAEGQPVPPAAQTVTYYFNIRGEKRHPRGQCECVCDWLPVESLSGVYTSHEGDYTSSDMFYL